MSIPNKSVVSIIDDDESVRESILLLARSLGLEACTFASAPDFLASTTLDATGCLVADVHMPRMTGFELHGRLTELGHVIPTILITAYPTDAMRARALADGILCYLSKPIDDAALIRCIEWALAG
jgi:FixJ family two-component response regulator